MAWKKTSKDVIMHGLEWLSVQEEPCPVVDIELNATLKDLKTGEVKEAARIILEDESVVICTQEAGRMNQLDQVKSLVEAEKAVAVGAHVVRTKSGNKFFALDVYEEEA